MIIDPFLNNPKTLYYKKLKNEFYGRDQQRNSSHAETNQHTQS